MLIEILTSFNIAFSIATLTIIYKHRHLINFYLKINNIIKKMDINEVLDMDAINVANTDNKKDRLAAIIAGGNSKQYLGKELQLSELDSMSNSEMEKLYTRYEARLGASMTKTLGNNLINLYVMTVSRFFPIEEAKLPALIQDLKEDPFVNHALTTSCCELYYNYGMYLAPLTAMLTTVKYINFENKKPELINKDGESTC